MDTQSTNFYTNLVKIFPYIVIGLVLSLLVNYLLLNAMTKTSPSSLGWPFDAGDYINGSIKLNYFGLAANYLAWTAILSIITPVLQLIFIPKKGNA